MYHGYDQQNPASAGAFGSGVGRGLGPEDLANAARGLNVRDANSGMISQQAERVFKLNAQLADLADALRNNTDRLLGAEPEPGGAGDGKMPAPGSAVDTLSAALNGTENLAARLRHQVERVGQL